MDGGGRMANPQDQLDMDQMAEAELARLYRQYRIMEGERKAFLDETTNKLAKQRKLIAGLRKERDGLLTDIKVATCQNQKRKDTLATKTTEKLLAKYDAAIAQLQHEKDRLEEIDEQIKKTEKDVSQQKLKEVTDTEYEFRIKSGKKSVENLENQLEVANKRFCSVLTENKKLREEIEHLLKERTQFNAIWEKLLLDLGNGKRFMLDLIEQATTAYDQREEWCSKLQALQVRTHNDVISHTQEMREMQRELDHDGKLREFLTVKGQRRVMRDLEEKEQKKRELEKEEIEKQMRGYQETLEKIKEFCGEEDIDKIAAKYLKQEEENFALFNYVNELNHELEVLSESIRDVQNNIDEQQEASEEQAQAGKDNLESLHKALEEANRQGDEDEQGFKRSEDEMKMVLDEIKNIFDELSCDYTPILNLLGKDSAINEENVMIYLGLIQKKVSTLVTNVYFKEKSLMKHRKPRKTSPSIKEI